MQNIEIRGAKTHNLKNINLKLPRGKLIVITGISGSGKSSLAFDTLYAEGQRRYVESLSSYARQFLSMMEKPEVEHIEGLSPAISIEQKSTSHNPRSTVGTVTEIYDYLRLLFARVGKPKCPTHTITLEAQTISQMVDLIIEYPVDTKLMILAPVVQNKKGKYVQLLESLQAQGYVRARIDGDIYELDDPPELQLHKKHNIEVVIDRIKVKPEAKSRIADSLETAVELASGLVKILLIDKPNSEVTFSAKFACPKCGYSISELEPRLFSFNNPSGACETCDGLGVKMFMDPNKIIFDDSLSLSCGAIRGWDKHNFYYYSMLQSLASHYNFDLDMPFKKLPRKIKHCILYGSAGEIIKFEYTNDKSNRKVVKEHEFEGIITNMERRYHETTSQWVRDELGNYLTQKVCPDCNGARLNIAARNVYINDNNLPWVSELSIKEALEYVNNLQLDGWRQEIADKILKEISLRLEFLINVGLDYLTLSRSADTLSGGEAQRIRLASQIGAGLVGVMYVLDEPSIGLHQRDNERLLKTLTHLRDLGNTVIVVEHDEEAIMHADHVVDIGIGAGVHGGSVVAQGSPQDIMRSKQSLTGQYLSLVKKIEIPKQRRVFDPEILIEIKGACANNLKDINVDFPVGVMTVVSGVSGSGKSTLVNDTLYPIAAKTLNGAQNVHIADFDEIYGLEHFDKVVDISQSPIGRTPRSNPATYTGLFTDIRDLFAATEEARARGYKPGRFSFNVKGGRCEACRGDGLIKVEMHFLPDVYVPCDVCKGKRYNRETLEVHYKGKNINQVLDMTVEEGLNFFKAVPAIARKLEMLVEVGLSYVKLGQSATTLSGGEAQRIKLAKELSRRDTGRTLYILDEPTTGLHFADIDKLLKVLHRLTDKGNTVIIIEHNLDVIKTADWIIDLGPEGGDGGGEILACGTPEDITKVRNSYTGKFLKPILLNNKNSVKVKKIAKKVAS